MVQRYTLDTLDLQGIEYVEDAYVELDYKGAPTIYELEKEIQSGVHTNVDGEVGCPMCGCVDMFYREFNTKGRRYRCNSCFYNSEAQFESVKSQKDITLSSFGLVYVCDICGEEMDSYNKATVLRHIKKHEDDNKVSEAEYTFNPTDKPSGIGGWYQPETDQVHINLSNQGFRDDALEDKYTGLFDTLAHEYGHKVTWADMPNPLEEVMDFTKPYAPFYANEFAAFMVQTEGDFERSRVLAVLHPACFMHILSQLPYDTDHEGAFISDETLEEFFSTLDIESNRDLLFVAQRLITYPDIPEPHKEFMTQFLDYANKSFEAESFYVNEKCDDCGISFGNPARENMVWMITIGDWDEAKKVLLFCNECHEEQYDESDWDNIIEFEAPELFRADGYGLWTDAQLDAPDAPWTPEVISPIYPLKGYEKPVEEVRAQLKRSLVGQEIRMFGPQNEAEAARMSQSLDWWKTVGFSEPQPVGTFGKVTGVSEVNPNRPWVIGVWVTIISGGSEKHPIGSRVWFHVKDANFPNSLRKGWEKGDYMAEGGQPTQNHIVQKSCLCCGEYPCLQPQGFSNDFIYRPEHEAFFEELKQDYDYSYNPNSGPCGEGSHYFHSKDGVKAMFFQMEEADIMPEIMMMRPQDTFMVLEWLESENAGEGNAGKMLSKITQAADKTGTTLYLDCGYHDFAETPNDIPSDEICGWYETYGFVRAAGDYPRDMIRLPHDTLWLKEQESAFGQTRWAEGEEALYWAARTNMRDAENELEVPRYVYHATPQKYWEEIQQQGGMIPQIGYMTYRAFLPRYRNERFGAGLDISPEDYKEWLTAEIGGHKIWATSQQKSSMYGSMIEPMSLLEDNAILQIDTTGLNFEYYDYEEYFTNDPIPLSSINHLYFLVGERYGEEYPDYLLFELSPEYDDTVEDDEELADLLHDENYERFLRAAEDYEIRRWIKVLRDEDPEGWDDIDWEDDTAPSPYDDDWHDDIDWEAEGSKRTPFDKDPKWLDHYYQQHKRQGAWNPKRDYLDDYYGPSVTAKKVASPNSRRMRKGGLFLNWLNTFGPTVDGMRRLFKFFGIPTPPPPKKQQGSPYQPSTKNPWPWGSPESSPWKKPDDYYPYPNPDRRGEYK